MTPMNPRLIPVKVLSEKSALFAAMIRNECLEFMTRNQSRLTIERQIKWFNERPLTTQLYTYQENGAHYPIGYGLIRLEDEKWLVSGGLAEGWRGKGLGGDIFRHLASLRKETWLEVLISNERAVKVYKKLGYEEQFRTETVITMLRIGDDPII
jgi:ribosomal protein S18 acetylase RimI-like enzyme